MSDLRSPYPWFGGKPILCGYEGHFAPPPGWETVEWKANGGYGNVAGNLNKHRERLWCSPACLRPAPPAQLDLLGAR